MLALIPTIAILPILLYIGMLIGSQAFQETPKSHAPAIILALTPHLALGRYADEWRAGSGGDLRRHGGAHGGNEGSGVLYKGLEVLGGGSILGGLILGAMAVCIIDRHFMKGAGCTRRSHLDVLWLHARAPDRHRPRSDGGTQLSHRRRNFRRLRQIGRCRPIKGDDPPRAGASHSRLNSVAHERFRLSRTTTVYNSAGAFSSSATRFKRRPAAPPSRLDDRS